MAVIHSEIREGYLPLIETTEDVLVGEAAVTNLNGICDVFAINTTDNDLEIELPPQEIIPFEYYNLPGEDFDEASADEDYSPPVNEAEEIIKNISLDHLNPEEKDDVLEIVRGDVPINTRPYRFSPSQTEEVEKVIQNMKTEGAIQNSKSPYNPPLLIISKKIDATGKK